MKQPHLENVVKLDIFLILFVSLVIRLATFNGAFGSDDLVYFGRAVELSDGIWSSADYNGALRYGFNIPAGILVYIFGKTFFAANLWPLACSLVEIAAVYLFANQVFGRRAAIFSALLLCTTPLHMAVATRIHADPVVSMFVTLSFVLLYFGATRKNVTVLFAAGVSIGSIFWTKELAAVTWLAFLPLLWIFRQQWRSSLYVILGISTMMLLHGLLMSYIAGDPLHLIKVVSGAVNRNFINTNDAIDGPFYYLKYLFFDLRHTGFLSFFALLTIAFCYKANETGNSLHFGCIYTLIWLIGLLLILSFFPVSLHPLRFPMKQSNYITLFIAPIAILTGFGISILPRTLGYVSITTCLLAGIVLGAFQQADYRIFTSNSKAVARFSTMHPDDIIVGSTNNSSLGNLWADQMFPGMRHARILSFRNIMENDDILNKGNEKPKTLYTILDRQTINWFSGNSKVVKALPCWKFESTLQPEDLGLGNMLAGLADGVLPSTNLIAATLSKLSRPLAADVYRVDGRDILCQ